MEDIKLDRVSLYSKVDVLVKMARQLEEAELKIKECNEFLQKNAARKKAYVSVDYFKELIE